MDCSTPDFPVHHQLLELAQTHIHWVSDAIQPSHPLSSPSPPWSQPFPASRSFQNELALCISWPKYWSFSFSISPSNEHSELISVSIVKRSESEVTQSCPTLCDVMDCSLPGSSVHGIFQAIVLEWIAISFSSIVNSDLNYLASIIFSHHFSSLLQS